jgi:methionine sulfoxide reductase heme-binding subunit
MTATYRAVQWNRHKIVYDLCAAGAIALFLIAFVVVGVLAHPSPNEIVVSILVMRALGVGAFAVLHVILAIGPLHRLDARFAPLLYNRRHLGVMLFAIGLLHALIATGFYGGFGVENPLVALLAGYGAETVTGLPFEIFGFGALIILFLMAATSHDFWLARLSPGWWKALHTLVYVAYALLVAHVVFGALQSERSFVLAALVGVGALALTALHVVAGVRENGRAPARTPTDNGWVEVVEQIGRAHV